MPQLELVFAAAPSTPLRVRPRQYMVEFPNKVGLRLGTRHYCVAVFDNQKGGTVIGASIMRQREVIFDIGASSITFVDADCDRITPATSHLRDAYTFASCPRPTRPNATAASGAGVAAGVGASWFSQRLRGAFGPSSSSTTGTGCTGAACGVNGGRLLPG